MQTNQFKIDDNQSEFLFIDVQIKYKCPKCNSDKGYFCQTTSNKKSYKPHSQRLKLHNK